MSKVGRYDIDYWHKLDKKDAQFLKAFISEYYYGVNKGLGLQAHRRRDAYRRDIMQVFERASLATCERSSLQDFLRFQAAAQSEHMTTPDFVRLELSLTDQEIV